MNDTISMWRRLLAGAALGGFACVALAQGTAPSAQGASVATDTRGFVGITLTSQIHEAGAAIGDVRAGFPAEQAGLRAGDVIIGFQGSPVEDSQSLYARIRTVQVGEAVDIDYLRDGQRQSARMVAVDREGRALPPAAVVPKATETAAISATAAPVVAVPTPAVRAPDTAAVAPVTAETAPTVATAAAAPKTLQPTPAARPETSATMAAAAVAAAPVAAQAQAPSAVPSAAASEHRTANLDRAREAFALMDQQDLFDGLEEADRCTAQERFDCADRTLARIEELIADDEQRSLWLASKQGVADGRSFVAARVAAEQERLRQIEMARREEEERMRQEEAAEREQQSQMMWSAVMGGLQTFQSEMQRGYEQQRQQQAFLDNINAQAQAQQRAREQAERQRQADAAAERARQQAEGRRAFAAQLADGIAYRNQQIAQTTNAAERQRLQNDNAKAMQAAGQIGMASEVSAQATADTRANNAAAQAQRQAEQQRIEQQRVEQQRLAQQQAEQQRLAEQRRVASASMPQSTSQWSSSSTPSVTTPVATPAREAPPAAVKPLRFVMIIGMMPKEGDTANPNCYSNVITRPGPPGWGGPGWLPTGSGEQARQTVFSMKSAFIARCESASGRKATSEGNFTWVSNGSADDDERLTRAHAERREDTTVTMN